MYKFFVCITLLIASSVAAPAKDELMFEGPNDTATVESTVREARAAPSHIEDLVGPGVKDAFLYVYGDEENDDGDVHGYSKKMKDKGQDGYKHKDSFHKSDGDKYGYEKHAEYGQENKAEIDGANEEGLKHSNFEAEGGDSGEETKKSYAVFEKLNEDEKKQPKKKIESDYSFFGDDGGSYYGDESSEGDGEAESESAEGDDGGVESEEADESEESVENEEAEEEED